MKIHVNCLRRNCAICSICSKIQTFFRFFFVTNILMYADAPAYVIWLDLVRDSQNEMKFMWLLERGGRGDRC